MVTNDFPCKINCEGYLNFIIEWHFTKKGGGGFVFAMLTFLAVIQLLSHVQLFATPWTAAHQASLSPIISQRLLKLMSIVSVMPSNHLILYCPVTFLSTNPKCLK